MVKKRKILLIALPIIVGVMLGFFLFGQPPQASPESTPLPQSPSTQSPGTPETITSTPKTEVPEELPPNLFAEPEELPPNLFVLPEAPLGPLTVVLACFLALLIMQRKSKVR